MNHWKLTIWTLLLLLGGSVLEGRAQDNVLARAERMYGHLAAGRGDSIYAALNDEARRQLSPAVFNDTWRQLEAQFGPLKQAGAWKLEQAQGVTLYCRDLVFERYRLRLLLAFDADGRMNTIRVVPAPEPVAAPAVSFDDRVMEERDITVGADGFRLPGTLTLPRVADGRKVPCVVLVHGSGPNDRDETIGPNKPFRDLAWLLARRGIAVVRYDKRTRVYGADVVPLGRKLDMDVETGDDAVAAVALARTLPEVAADSVFVLGHSQGGMMAPRIAERSGKVAGIIVLAGLVRPFEDALLEQSEYIASLSGASGQAQAQLDGLKRQVDNVKRLGTDAFNDSIPLPLNIPKEYWQFLKRYNPIATAASLECPVLVLQGERDYQVTMLDYGLWRVGLLKKGNASFKSYPALNHLLQEGKGKATPFEYQKAVPVPDYVADDIAGFIRGRDIR
ncbi:alpha/beta fold hydrolase [uncultured Bacteroides sp.]|uniref:alpha/beta fold hydrolase n=1 Tax=uncultured Bacteroides sp. TaxID=162156 RepID=UPI002634985A|nr:alpha/beta fold hydrolase [uncultured Bacteroides sp.]